MKYLAIPISIKMSVLALFAVGFWAVALPGTAHADMYIDDGVTVTPISTTPYTSPIILAGDATITQDVGDTTDYELSGVISGGFSLDSDIAAGKTVILSGNNTYTGTTTVTSGTLQVGNGGTTGTVGAGAVVNNDTFKIDRSGTTTFSTVVPNATGITGSGDIDIDNAGVLVMNRDIATTAGTLDIYANSAAGSSLGTIRMTSNITIDVGTGSGIINGVSNNTTGRGIQITGPMQMNGDITLDGDSIFTTGTSYGIVMNATIDSTHGALVFDGDSATTAHGSGIYMDSTTINATEEITLTGDQPSLATGNVDSNTAGVFFVRRNNVNTSGGDVTISGTGPRGISANTSVNGDVSVVANNATMTGSATTMLTGGL